MLGRVDDKPCILHAMLLLYIKSIVTYDATRVRGLFSTMTSAVLSSTCYDHRHGLSCGATLWTSA